MSERIFDWTYIGEINTLTPCQMHHCDTRDFYINGYEMSDDYMENKKLLQSRMKYSMEDYMCRADEILGILQALENETGGNGSWRHLTVDGEWLKYIRFLRHGDVKMFGKTIPTYIIYTGNGQMAHPILREKLTSFQQQDPEDLCHIKNKK